MTYARALASGTVAGNIIRVNRYAGLPNVTDDIIAMTCNDMNECAGAPCQNEGICVDGFQRYECLCPFAATGINCEKSCSARLDVVFVLDLSGSVTQYRTIIDLIRAIIYGLDVTNDQVLVGFVTYSTDVNDHFFLNMYSRSRSALITAVNFNELGGTTNTQGALNFVKDSVFTTSNGDRPGVDNVVILLSDGYSDEPEGSSPDANAGSSLKQSGATIYTIGFGAAPNILELNTLASAPTSMHTFVLPSANTTDITTTANSLIAQLCA
jgi:collagen type VI alpha